jgi:hypothetical protein
MALPAMDLRWPFTQRLYCVAPLQLGPLPVVTYDVWLIGKACCQAGLCG